MSVNPVRSGSALFFTLLAFALAPGLVRAAPAEAIETRIERQGEYITVNASALMQVDARIAWEVLSDYDNLAQFIPDMKSSRVVSRDANRVLVEQKGEFGFFFYRQPVDVVLEVVEEPRRRIDARRISGNIRDLETHYELKASDAGV
ncbi:MAG TPA: SRPBCC family protein, partial [Burkholderiales bacterium]|nr:SRPBCC family protein [Burkholderiales bacterium]